MRSLWRAIIAVMLVAGLLGASAIASAGEAPDGRAHPVSYVWVIDAETGELVVMVCFEVDWDSKPPTIEEFFSFFFSLLIEFDELLVEAGWELHDGTQTILGSPSLFVILDNGCVVIGTGYAPGSDDQVHSVDAEFGSWLAGADSPIFGNASEAVDSGSVVTGDPMAIFGGQIVFDLMTFQMIMPSTTTTSTEAPTETSGSTEATVTTQQVTGGGGDDPAIVVGDDGGLSGWIKLLLALGLLAFLLFILRLFGIWTPWWEGPGGSDGMSDELHLG